MPAAKSLFLERIHSLQRSSQIYSVTNKDLTDHAHNSVARMLRNGLAIVGFAALEDFIKLRTSEVLSEIGRTGVLFRDLPEKLRVAVTAAAVDAFSYQLSIRPKTDRISYIQEHAQKVASTSNTAYELTPHAFGYSQANINAETVSDILKSFKVNDAWGQMSQISSRLGLTALPLEETFKSAALRRHRAAHVAHADTPQGDLAQFVREAFAIAIGFDALLSKALSKLVQHDRAYLSQAGLVSAVDIKVRNIRNERGVWKEFVEGRSKAVKTDQDANALCVLARARAIASTNLLVRFSESGDVIDWECH